MGPTATGKTTLAVELVQRLPMEIVSVDSAMVYRGMDIGTAKPGPDILRIAPHRLIDIREPEESYSAGDFRLDAARAIEDIHAAGRIPLLVGGTGLYFRSLEEGISRLPGADPVIRAGLVEEASARGWAALHERLAELDPASAARIHPRDPQRIQRALEIHAITGRPASALYREGREAPLPYPVIKLIIAPEDKARHRRDIELRFLDMVKQGLVEEVESLKGRPGLTAERPSMRLLGYRQVWRYLDGELDYNGMIAKAITATRQLAKRQMTWLRSERNARWLDCRRPGLSDFLLNFLQEHPLLGASL